VKKDLHSVGLSQVSGLDVSSRKSFWRFTNGPAFSWSARATIPARFILPIVFMLFFEKNLQWGNDPQPESQCPAAQSDAPYLRKGVLAESPDSSLSRAT
jgi:hypothetical protein